FRSADALRHWCTRERDTGQGDHHPQVAQRFSAAEPALAGLKPCATDALYLHFRTSNHRKNGPPMSAVTMPTGSSPDDQMVRASASQAMRNAAPNSADA